MPSRSSTPDVTSSPASRRKADSCAIAIPSSPTPRSHRDDPELWRKRRHKPAKPRSRLPALLALLVVVFAGMLLFQHFMLADEHAASKRRPAQPPPTAVQPPALLVHNQDDPVAWPTGSMEYARQLTLSKEPSTLPPSTLHLYTRGGHGFGLCQDGKQAKPAGGFAECCDWMLAAQRWLQELGNAPGWPTKPCDTVFKTGDGEQCETRPV